MQFARPEGVPAALCKNDHRQARRDRHGMKLATEDSPQWKRLGAEVETSIGLGAFPTGQHRGAHRVLLDE